MVNKTDKIVDVDSLEAYLSNCQQIGFQASELGRAREILKQIRDDKQCTVFLGFTANLVASGMRGYIAKIIREELADVIVTTGGAIDHDVIKSIFSYKHGDFCADDYELHKHGINRIGDIFVKNNRYEELEKISYEVMQTAIEKYGQAVSPSELAAEYGNWILKTKDYSYSFLAQAAKANIPVFSPGIIDSAIGLHTYFFKQKKEGKAFQIDVTKDLKKLADITINSERTGAIVLGGGISKHHIIGVNILKNGLDYAVYITTAHEYDGSLSGAKTKEAISWGKIKAKKSAKHCTVNCDVTIALPLLLHEII